MIRSSSESRMCSRMVTASLPTREPWDRLIEADQQDGPSKERRHSCPVALNCPDGTKHSSVAAYFPPVHCGHTASGAAIEAKLGE